MNRRQFVSSAAAALTLTALTRTRLGAQVTPAPTPAASPTPSPIPPWTPVFTPLRRNVGLFSGRGGTIGWLTNSAGIAIVDTQFPDTAEAMIAGLPGREGRDVTLVVNTHHHGDHTGGNPVLKRFSKKFVAHANVPELLRAAAERNKQPFNPLVDPTETFPETWSQEIGDEVISGRYFGPAHTRGDIVVSFEKANVVHMGDLMFNRVYPVIDRPGGANIQHWITVLEKIAETYPSDAIFVFGHGNPKFGVTGGKSDLLILRDYLTALLEHTRNEIKAGKTRAEIVGVENFAAFPDFNQPLPNRFGANLGVAFDELTAGS